MIDNQTLGPGDSITRRVRRGQPGPLVLPLPRLLPPAPGDERLVHRRVAVAALLAAGGGARCSARCRAPPTPPTAGSRSPTTSGRTPSCRSTSASTSPGTGSAPTRCTRSPASRRTPRASTPTRARASPSTGSATASSSTSTSRASTRSAASSTARCAARSRSQRSPATRSSEPDPVPKSNVDLQAAEPARRGPRAQRLPAQRHADALLAQRARPDRDRVLPPRPQAPQALRRLRPAQGRPPGLNSLRFGIERNHFTPRSGRYLAKVTATDRAANRTRPTKLRFRILG